MTTRRLIGGGLSGSGATDPGECGSCHVRFEVDQRVREPHCPDCGDPVLTLNDVEPPSSRPRPRIRNLVLVGPVLGQRERSVR